MKITNEGSIKSSEKDLIDTIIRDIDWHAVEAIIREKHHIGIKEDARHQHGDIVVHEDQVAYRVNFEVTVPFSMLFDRAGAFVSMSAFQAGDENRPVAGETAHQEDMIEDEILEELSREMDALEDDPLIELTEIVGNRSEATGSEPYGEASFFDSAVNG